MPFGKPAGVRCAQLADDNTCKIYGRPERPQVCADLRPSCEMCGSSSQEAYAYLSYLEEVTDGQSDQNKSTESP
jgi:hypothetical protein